MIMKQSRLVVLLTAASLLAIPHIAAAQDADDSDPWESVNRAIFDFNDTFDEYVLEPVSDAYQDVVPGEVREHVHKAFVNLGEPISAANQLLQGNFEDAGTTTLRFFTNSTAGVAGIFDITETQDANKQADFGQTLGSWGVDSGPYVVLPILGPSTARDTVGRAVDTFADPVYLYVKADDHTFSHPNWTWFGVKSAEAIDTRTQLSKALADLKKNSLDYYATIRSIFLQRRAAKVASARGECLPGDASGSISDYDTAAAEDNHR